LLNHALGDVAKVVQLKLYVSIIVVPVRRYPRRWTGIINHMISSRE
jgi:hypothetical protein